MQFWWINKGKQADQCDDLNDLKQVSGIIREIEISKGKRFYYLCV